MRQAPTILFALAVGVAFADSSIVVLALPDLYSELDTSIVGVSWVITTYNLVLAVAAFALLPVTRRVRPTLLVVPGLVVFLGASIACGLSSTLTALVVGRGVQGLGAALVLAGSLPVFVALAGSAGAGLAAWTTAATMGVAVGPALGGLLTELFDWRAIFLAQAPLAGLALVAALDARARTVGLERARPAVRRLLVPNLGLLLISGGLVGALFLSVLLVVTVWDHGPLTGAIIVSALPLTALLVHPLARRAGAGLTVPAGAVVLALGLVALGLLPSNDAVYAVLALAVCGAGFGLAVPPLVRESASSDAGRAWSGTFSVGARHVGLVLALLIVAPLLASELEEASDRATRSATAVILDAPLRLETKVPIAIDLTREFDRVPEGEIPDLRRPFEENDAGEDAEVAATRDDLLDAIEAVLTRSFRSSFFVSAAFALLALAPALLLRRSRPAA
jgi:predicted MFS family arabinose efflux permease